MALINTEVKPFTTTAFHNGSFVESGPPLRVRYRLTECGQALEASLRELGRWADRCLPEDGQCPERFRG